jgi:hypothetical protein
MSTCVGSTTPPGTCGGSITHGAARSGVAGRFAYDTPGLEALLGMQGDITALVPLSQPAPTPGPINRSFTPEQAAALEEWAGKPHLWHLASVAARAWRDAKVGPS